MKYKEAFSMPESELIVSLSDASRGDVSKVGSKAANLNDLIDKGFPVPDGFVVTTAAYTLFVNENKGLQSQIESELAGIDYNDPRSVEEYARKIREAIEGSSFPMELASEIRERLKGMGGKPVAVRSSATSEDLGTASFAGQLETFLNVRGADSVIESVKGCYASLWTGRALSYMHRNSVSYEDAKMAVLIQEMVPSRSSGVMFTVSPLTTDGSEFLIESTFGLGEALVSGRATPDKYVLGRDREGFRVLAKEIGTKTTIAQASRDGVEYIDLEETQGSKPSLTDEKALELAQVGAKIEAVLGSPQDIEWSIGEEEKLYILQSRPITTLRIEAADEILWTRGYSDDYWNDPVTPLYFELLGDHLTQYVNIELNDIMGYKSLDSEKTRQLLRLHKAHAYFNLEVLKRKVENEIPPFLRNNDVLNYFPEGSGPYGKETMRRLRFNTIGRIWAEVRVTFKDPNGSGGKTDKAYEEWVLREFDPFFLSFDERLRAVDGATLSGYIELADEIHELMIGHYRLVRYGIPVHNIGMNLITQYLLVRFLGADEGRRVYPILVSGLKHKTSETNAEIEELSVKIRASPELRRMILEKPSINLYDLLSTSNLKEVAEFKTDFDAFLTEYGVRGFTREVYYPRWGDEPKYVFDILKSLVSGDAIDVAAAEERSGKLRLETEANVKTAIDGQIFGFAKWSLLSGILGNARRYIVFREQQRFTLDKWITMSRQLHLALGARLVEKGIISQPSDIFFLTKSEVRSLALRDSKETAETIRSYIESRRAEFLRYENSTPPKFLQGEREFNDPPPDESSTFRGIPASQGVLTAPVRVLGSIDDIWQVQTGEILVVPRTDPGWTPVFSKIGGLVTEMGGVLSHGAVVSREYGIPAVTNVHAACSLFKTGQRVTIDGVRGIVTLE
jgi:pyruvate,water dikinase